MIERGWLGEKRGQGFYKRVGKGDRKKSTRSIWKTLEYHPAQKAALRLASRRVAEYRRPAASACARWWPRTDRAGTFLWKLFSDLFLYSADMVPEISDRIVEIDRAMRWGYANTLGPFELWDALGVEDTVARMRERRPRRFRRTSRDAVHRARNRSTRPPTATAARTPSTSICAGSTLSASSKTAPGHHRAQRREARARRGEEERRRSLIDLGDGVLCLEFHSKMNSHRRRPDHHDPRRHRRDRARISRPWSSPTRARTSASAPT